MRWLEKRAKNSAKRTCLRSATCDVTSICQLLLTLYYSGSSRRLAESHPVVEASCGAQSWYTDLHATTIHGHFPLFKHLSVMNDFWVPQCDLFVVYLWFIYDVICHAHAQISAHCRAAGDNSWKLKTETAMLYVDCFSLSQVSSNFLYWLSFQHLTA